MRTKLLFPLLVFVLLFCAMPVDAKTIVKIGRDVDISEDQQATGVIAVGGQITVRGLVEKNVVAVGGSVVITGDAVVRGNVLCIGGVVVRGSGARIFGNVTEVNSANFLDAVSSAFYEEEEEWSWLTDIIYFCFFTFLLMLALMLTFLFPRPLNAIIDSVAAQKTKSFFWGILGALMIAPLFMLLALSFIGIPLIPLAFSLVLLAFIFGFLAMSALLGRFVLTNFFRHHKLSLMKEALLGMMLWWVIGWAPFYTGMMIKAAVITMGFGGVLVALIDRGRNRQKTAHQAF
ncbi:MAG TPA: hypothetical protein PK842_08555 [Smithella sp.]|nr:hypothetical protein [Smithella sp.]HOO36159.1 hypothetical protein [Smithella sp.]HPK22822.1 hypothetical protein [Smithella sp.]HPR14911.1 hypothetical protein [Smithella sp.]